MMDIPSLYFGIVTQDFIDELVERSLGNWTEEHFTVKDLLDKHRDELDSSYDLI